MTLYEINNAILAAIAEGIDPETGEIVNTDALDALTAAREEKIDNIACYIKNLTADAKAIREEEVKLAERRRAMENKAERLTKYLSMTVGEGEKFSSPRAQIGWRKSSKVEVSSDFVMWAQKYGHDDLLNYSEPKPALAAIKDAIKGGMEIPGAEIVTTSSIQIK